MPTNDELRAMIERLADTKIRFASEDERQATIRRNATTDEAALMLRSILAERERDAAREAKRQLIHLPD